MAANGYSKERLDALLIALSDKPFIAFDGSLVDMNESMTFVCTTGNVKICFFSGTSAEGCVIGESEEGTFVTPINDPEDPSHYYEISSSNHDIYVARIIDTNTGMPIEVSNTICYPPMEELESIDSDCVSISYDLFNNIVKNIQRLYGTSEKMDALRAYQKLTTVV